MCSPGSRLVGPGIPRAAAVQQKGVVFDVRQIWLHAGHLRPDRHRFRRPFLERREHGIRRSVQPVAEHDDDVVIDP